jgi:hypothetical protein
MPRGDADRSRLFSANTLRATTYRSTHRTREPPAAMKHALLDDFRNMPPLTCTRYASGPDTGNLRLIVLLRQ